MKRRQPQFESDHDREREENRYVWRNGCVLVLITGSILAAMAVALLKTILYP